MWTPDHSYWPQKKNSSYYPALSEIPFPSWKITEKIQFFPKKQPFSIKEKEAQNGLDSMRSFFFGVTPSSHEKWSNPYRKWRLSGRSIFNFLVQKQLFFMDFHSNSFKCFIFFNDFSYKFTSFVRKTPDATTWFRIEKSGFFQYCPQNPHFWTFKKYNHIYFYKCKFLANLSLCGPGGFPHKCLLRFYLRVFSSF